MAAKRRAAESPARKKARLAKAALLHKGLAMLPELEAAIDSLDDEGEIAPKHVATVMLVLAEKVASIKASHQESKAPPSKRY